MKQIVSLFLPRKNSRCALATWIALSVGLVWLCTVAIVNRHGNSSLSIKDAIGEYHRSFNVSQWSAQQKEDHLHKVIDKLGLHASTHAESGQKWVILNTYMRGGSTFLGSFFDENDEVFYWYEPVYNIYNAMMAAKMPLNPLWMYYTTGSNKTMRNLSAYEITYILNFLTRMMSCDLQGMPEEILSFWFLWKSRSSKPHYIECAKSPSPTLQKCQSAIKECGKHIDENLHNLCHFYMADVLNNTIVNEIINSVFSQSGHIATVKHPRSALKENYLNCMEKVRYRVSSCAQGLSKTCQSKRIIATKLIRGNYEDFLPNLLKIHQSTYIIHYIRDPRGITQSRKEANLLSNDVPTEASQLCELMYRDFVHKNKLKELYPDNVIDLKYEDLVQEPQGVAEWIYGKIGESEVPSQVQIWINNATMRKDLEKENAFNVFRRNSTATAFAWKNKLSSEEKSQIDDACFGFYELAGYDI